MTNPNDTHLVNSGNTLLDDDAVWQILQILQSVSNSDGQFCADVVGILFGE